MINYPPPSSLGDENLQALGLGLAGAHRTGKTTIAKRLAEANECPFVQTSMSAIANDMGIRVGLDLDFNSRIHFQEAGLKAMEQAYAQQGGTGLFIADRTPLDLAAYVITAWHPSLADEGHTLWADDYVARCLEATNRWFFQIGVIQPGIPWEDAEQKAENIPFYREALNSTIIGLAYDEYIRPACCVVPRDMLKIEDRMKRLTIAYSESISEYADFLKANLPLQ